MHVYFVCCLRALKKEGAALGTRRCVYSLSVLWNDCASAHSPQLFHFDVHDDVRTVNDARIEKDESHAVRGTSPLNGLLHTSTTFLYSDMRVQGKIVERHWYERNKHIFPASRWEVYDPQKKWDKYTIHGGEVHGK